jgi:hypothetical protein
VLLQFEATPVRKLGAAVTLASLALVALFIIAGLTLRISRPRRR